MYIASFTTEANSCSIFGVFPALKIDNLLFPAVCQSWHQESFCLSSVNAARSMRFGWWNRGLRRISIRETDLNSSCFNSKSVLCNRQNQNRGEKNVSYGGRVVQWNVRGFILHREGRPAEASQCVGWKEAEFHHYSLSGCAGELYYCI